MHSEDSRESAISNTDDHAPLGTRSEAAAPFACADDEDVGAAALVTVTTVVGGEVVEGLDVAVEATPFATLDWVELEPLGVELLPSVMRLLAVGAASPLAENTTGRSSVLKCRGSTELNIHSKLPDCSASSTACWKIWVAFAGTSETKPMRGGSTEGCVRFP